MPFLADSLDITDSSLTGDDWEGVLAAFVAKDDSWSDSRNGPNRANCPGKSSDSDDYFRYNWATNPDASSSLRKLVSINFAESAVRALGFFLPKSSRIASIPLLDG